MLLESLTVLAYWILFLDIIISLTYGFLGGEDGFCGLVGLVPPDFSGW